MLQPQIIPTLDNTTASFSAPNEISFGVTLYIINKLWGIGLNYTDHTDDLDETYLDAPASFMRSKNAVVPPGGSIKLPPTERTDWVTAEAEIGVVIGRECSQISQDKVDEVSSGYVSIIDMTAEDILEKNLGFLLYRKVSIHFIVIES